MGLLKLQLASEKSYITAKADHETKFKLVVQCTHAEHRSIMEAVWREACKGKSTKMALVELRNNLMVAGAAPTTEHQSSDADEGDEFADAGFDETHDLFDD